MLNGNQQRERQKLKSIFGFTLEAKLIPRKHSVHTY